MRASLRGYWEQAEPYQKFLYGVGGLLILSAVFHAGVLVVTGGPLAGDVSWRKPILFGESFGLTAVSIAWVMGFLPRRRWLGWPLAGALGLANFSEVFWVSFQQWRGVPSHFNSNTEFDAALFSLAGFLILIAGIVIVTVTVLSLVALRASPSLASAIQIGLWLLVVGQFLGLMIIINDGPVFGAVGAMKVPHALALHGLQALPLLAWLLLFTPWSEERRTHVVLLGALGYIVLLAVEASQTFSGRAPLDLDAGRAVLFALGALLFAAAYGMGLLGLQPKAEPATD